MKGKNRLGDGNSRTVLYVVKEWLKVGTGETKIKYSKAGQERGRKDEENEKYLTGYNSEKCAGVNTVMARPVKGKLSV